MKRINKLKFINTLRLINIPRLFKLPIEKNLANLENELKFEISKHPFTVKVSKPKLFFNKNNKE